jgi:ubiquitin-protein ligase
MPGIAQGRLSEERRAWRKEHPVGFHARPSAKNDGSSDMMKWMAGVPGKEGTDWEGGVYKVSMEFTEEYPSRPPKCRFYSGGNSQQRWQQQRQHVTVSFLETRSLRARRGGLVQACQPSLARLIH